MPYAVESAEKGTPPLNVVEEGGYTAPGGRIFSQTAGFYTPAYAIEAADLLNQMAEAVNRCDRTAYDKALDRWNLLRAQIRERSSRADQVTTADEQAHHQASLASAEAYDTATKERWGDRLDELQARLNSARAESNTASHDNYANLALEPPPWSNKACPQPEPQATPQPPPPAQPPPTGNPPPKTNAPPQPAPAPKAKCPSCQKAAKELADLNDQIATQESRTANLREIAGVDADPGALESWKASERKLSDLKAKKAELEQHLLKCEQSCAPKAATDGYLANTTGSVLQGNVLSGDVLQGIGVSAAPVAQPNRSSDESETGQSDKSGEHVPPGQPPGRPSTPNR
jgi:hypothetical protein